jgi:Arc/MetJ family transcription regulator
MAGTDKQQRAGGGSPTSVMLDDEIIREAMQLTGAKSKSEVIDEALRALIRLRKQARIWDLFGTVAWEGNLDAMRRAGTAGC